MSLSFFPFATIKSRYSVRLPASSDDKEEIWAGEVGKLPQLRNPIDSSQTIRGIQTDTITGLQSDMKYGFFMRGYPEQ